MTKADLIEAVARETEITKVAAAAQAIDAITGSTAKHLKKGGRISLTGFDTFTVANRRARTGRNPRTGQEIKIPASKTAKFKPGNALKEALRQDWLEWQYFQAGIDHPLRLQLSMTSWGPISRSMKPSS